MTLGPLISLHFSACQPLLHLLTDPAGMFNGDRCSVLSLLISFKSDEVKLNQRKKTRLKHNNSKLYHLNGEKLRFSSSSAGWSVGLPSGSQRQTLKARCGSMLRDRYKLVHVYVNGAFTLPICFCNQEPAVTRLMSCSLVPLVPTGKSRNDRGTCSRSVSGRGSKGPLKGSPDQSRHPEANNCGIKIKICLSLDFISFIFPFRLFLAPSLSLLFYS